MKFWRAESSLHLMTIHICASTIFFRWVQSGQLSEHHIQCGEEYYIREEMSNKQYRQTLARQRWCLPKRGMFTDREAGKTATPQLRVSVSHLLIYHAALGSVWTHHYYRKTLFLSSSKWADWTSSTQKRQSLFCISLSTQDCSITMFPLRWRQLDLYSTASFHTLWRQQHFCCYQRYLLIRETAAVVLPRHIFKWRRTIWKESCLENSAVKAKMFDFCGLGVHISKQQFKGEGKSYVLPTCQYTTLWDSHTHREILLRRQFFLLAAMVPSILLLA